MWREIEPAGGQTDRYVDALFDFTEKEIRILEKAGA
jgi:hypothetical protein